MAVSKVDVHIQNPAGKRSNMTAKQIKYFGSKRQKAALKAKRSKARHTAPKKRHAKRSKPNPARRAAPKKHRKSSAPRHTTAKRKRKTSHRRRTVKRNPELVSFLLGNPAKRRTKVAHSKKRRKSSARSRSNAGTRRRRTTKVRRHSSRRRMNPAGISIKEMVYGGGGGLVGFFGSAGLTQMVLGSGNTGMTGYAVSLAATIGLVILSHMVLPREKAVTFGVGIGGIMNLGRRIISDQTPFGSYLQGAGMGDYMVANWGPPLMTDGLNGAMASIATNGPVTASSGINMLDYADVRAGSASGRPC